MNKQLAAISIITVAAIGVAGCVSNAVSPAGSSTSDPQSLKEALKGEWTCNVAGDSFEFRADEPDGTTVPTFVLHPKVDYSLMVEDGKWSVVNDSAYKGEGVKAEGSWTVEEKTLSFKVEAYSFLSGSTSEPVSLERRVLRKDFTIAGAPEKFGDSAKPEIKNSYGYPAKFTPISDKTFQVQQNKSTLACTQS